MKTLSFSLFITLSILTLIGYSQHKMGNKPTSNQHFDFYVKDGVKMSKINHTPMLIVNINDKVEGNSPAEMALNWINANKELLGINEISKLNVRFKRSSLSGHNIRFEQLLNGIPVYNSEIVVHISNQNAVTYVNNTYDPFIQNINTIPSLNLDEAFNLAKVKINVKGKVTFTSNNLFIYNNLDVDKLIYKVIIEAESPIGSWEVLVDAQTGEIIAAVDKAFYYNGHGNKPFYYPQPIPTNGTGNAFLSDPLSFANVTYGGNYSDNSDATNAQLDAATSSISLLDIDVTAGTYSLSGPYAQIVDHESPNRGLFSQASPNFTFNRFDNGFEAVNCYYIIDKSMRYINQTLGITLAPFQYSGGVQYDPHGLNGADNSHYTGGSGRIAFGEGGVDDAEDADVITHELGHGIHDWLTGGNLSQVNGLSEGSGDYWGQSYSRSLGQWTTADPEYNWFFNWDGHNPFWSGRITNYSATYPGGLVGQIHTDGQIWATTLMRIYDILGRIKVDKAFLEGLAMTGSSTSQQDAAIAVRQAAIDMGYTCPDIDVFTQEFTTTGYNMPPLNLAQFPPIIADATECESGIPADIIGNGNSLNWYDDFGLTNLLQTDTILNTGETSPGVYTYYVKYSDPACSVAPSDTVTLTINALPNVSLGNDLMLCENDTITLDAGSFSSYLWQDNSTNQTFFVDANAIGTGTFTYYVDVTDGNGCTNRDSIEVNVSICTTIDNNIQSNIEIYPNPTTNELNVVLEKLTPNTKIVLVDNLGKVVYSIKVKQLKNTINTSRLAAGVYNLVIKTEQESIAKKIIKE